MRDNEFIKIRDKFNEVLKPKAIKAEIDGWNFYTNSTDENREKLEKAQEDVFKLFRNEDIHNKLKDIEKSGLENKHLAKQLKKLIEAFGEESNSREYKRALHEKVNAILSKYSKYVPMLDNKEISHAELSKITQREKNIDLRIKAYEAKVKGGDLIAEDLVSLVKMRNEYAKFKGYNNFFEYILKDVYDVDSDYLQNLLDEVYNNAKEINTKFQNEYKKELADEYGIKANDLRAYHYGLLLDNNPAKAVNESLKTKELVVEISKKAFLGMGYDIDNMPIMLDLFPRKNKNTHGFCFDIDAGKDTRILANLTNTTESINALCHELGHSVYILGISSELSYSDQTAYPAVTEAVAMMMGDLEQKEDILKGIVADEALNKYKKDFKKSEASFITRNIFYIAFEKQMYENPDQNLQQLWHNLKVKYTGTNNNDKLNNEWATIPHFISHPGYMQNYFRAELIKAQMYKHLHKELGNITENKNTANYLNNNLFKYGTSLEENELIEKFTGEPLSSKAFCESLT
ncbi:MAG: M2 family metallopeptidase [Candidatus Riflebacteria bacterium]|nr:M2 family metallopeptidase [Candidatus Riflebacteria bacterium]